jgi:hypothetical protein
LPGGIALHTRHLPCLKPRHPTLPASFASACDRAIEEIRYRSERRIVNVPMLSSTVRCVGIRRVDGCADLQPSWQIWISQDALPNETRSATPLLMTASARSRSYSHIHKSAFVGTTAHAIRGNDRAAVANVDAQAEGQRCRVPTMSVSRSWSRPNFPFRFDTTTFLEKESRLLLSRIPPPAENRRAFPNQRLRRIFRRRTCRRARTTHDRAVLNLSYTAARNRPDGALVTRAGSP